MEKITPIETVGLLYTLAVEANPTLVALIVEFALRAYRQAHVVSALLAHGAIGTGFTEVASMSYRRALFRYRFAGVRVAYLRAIKPRRTLARIIAILSAEYFARV